MTIEPEIREIPAQPAALERASTTRDGIPAVVDRAFPALFERLGELGVTPAGAPFVRYLETGPRFELELGVPVPEGLGVEDGSLPAGRVAVLRHVGPYSGLPDAFSRLGEWIGASGEEVAGPGWEVYVTDPRGEPDSSCWVTDVCVPVR